VYGACTPCFERGQQNDEKSVLGRAT
jgi:hypothetical protein